MTISNMIQTATAAVLVMSLSLAFVQPASAQNASDPAAFEKLVAAAKKEGQVVLWTADNDSVQQAWAEAFRQEYGISVTFQRQTQGPLQARVEREVGAKRVQVDVIGFTLDPGWNAKMEAQNNLVRLDPRELPNVATLPNDFRGEYFAIQRINPMAFLYNSKLLKESDIPATAAEVVKDPRFKGLIATVNPRIGGTYFLWHYGSIQMFGEGGYRELIHNLLVNQRAQVVESVVAAQNQVASGELLAVFPAPVSLAQPIIEAGAPVKLKYIEPVISSTGSLQAVAGGPNPNAGKLLLNWLLSDKALEILCGTGGCAAPNRQIKGAITMPPTNKFYRGNEPYEVGVKTVVPFFQETLAKR